jgi:hypothetical protein
MATITKIRRVANPGGKRRRRFASRLRKKRNGPRMVRNRKGRFVKRAKAKRRPRTKVNRRRVRMANPPRRRTRRKSYAAKRRTTHRRRTNPVLIELGAINPRRRRTSVAKRRYRRAKARVNPRRRRRALAAPRARRTYRRRRRAVAVNPAPRRRRRYTRRRRAVANPYRRRRRMNRRRHYASRRNPFGVSTKDMVTMAGGILVGVAAAQYIPTLLPSTLFGTSSNAWTSILVTGASAFAAGYLAHRFIPGGFAQGVIAGGLALTLSQVLNAVAPASIAGPLTLTGVGDIMPGYFTIPQNTVTGRAPVMAMPASNGKSGGTGVGAFRGAFGGRR